VSVGARPFYAFAIGVIVNVALGDFWDRQLTRLTQLLRITNTKYIELKTNFEEFVYFKIIRRAAESFQWRHRFFVWVDVQLPRDKSPNYPATIIVPSLIEIQVNAMLHQFLAVVA
jgi:hypothetical protein